MRTMTSPPIAPTRACPRATRASAASLTLVGALAAAAAPLPAQFVTIGPGAPPTANAYGATLGTSGPLPSFAVGQSFVVPAGAAQLSAMQFWVRNDTNTTLPGQDFRLLTYRLFVAPFDSVTRRVGAPTFTSASRPGFADTTPTASAFAVGAAVQPGARYLAFLVPDEPVPPFVPLSPHHGRTVGFASAGAADDAYPDGRAYTISYLAGVDPGPLAGAWTAAGADLAFTATFATVPEPGTWALVGTGLAAAGAGVRARRRRAG